MKVFQDRMQNLRPREVDVLTYPLSFRAENNPDHPLAKDTILDTRSLSTRQRTYTSYRVARRGRTLPQAKWITTDLLGNKFPCILMEAKTLPYLNREELGQGGHLGERPTRAHESIT